MQKRIDSLSRLPGFSEKTAPFAFLVALLLSFGLLLPRLGIYQDDWVFVYNAYARGTQGLWNFFYYDGNPFAAYVNMGLFFLLGFKPLLWHIASLLARWLTVTVLWLVLRLLWPAHPRQTFFTALIFAVHPFFVLQPQAITYLHIWIGYFLLGLSLYWMLLSVRRQEHSRLYLGLSLAAQAAMILTVEYFAGLELLRPVLLWMALGGLEKDPRKRILRALKLWLPYLLVFGAYLFWRFFIYSVPTRNRNQPVLLEGLLQNPLAGLQTILYNLIPDSLLIVVTSWYKLVDPFGFDFTDRTNLLLAAAALLTALLAFVYFHRQVFPAEETTQPPASWSRAAFWLGLLIVVLGLIPPYIGGYFINDKNFLWSSRFGLASMLGASLVSVSLIELLVHSFRARLILLALAVGFSAAWHLRYTNDFRWSWNKQLNLYRQLVLRIPSLEADTALVAEGEILSFMGDYPTAYAVNTLFSRPGGDSGPRVNYWFFGITTNFSTRQEEFLQGSEIQDRHRSVTFKGRSDQALIISFEPEMDQCLWVIQPRDSLVRFLPHLLREAAHLSALERIQPRSGPNPFLAGTLGLTYPEDWCTYYTRADLARQQGDWEQVAALWKAAGARGFAPSNGFELMPFVEAYARLGDWDQAAVILQQAQDAPPSTRLTLCDLWLRLPETPERNTIYESLEPTFGCSSN